MRSQAISRGDGRSIIAAIAYRAAERIVSERTGEVFDYTRKSGVVHSEIIAPENAPAWMFDRASLWNGADFAEKRCDSQTGREIRVALPSELAMEEQLKVVRDFIKSEFVSRGMVADFSIHHDNPDNPHAHIVLTTRSIDENGFGKKCRDWNDKGLYGAWREVWANTCNHELQRAGHDMRIDHRSYADQGIALEPTVHIGKSPKRAERDAAGGGYVTQDRLAEQDRIIRSNGEAIIACPEIALDAISRQRSTFTRYDVGRWLHSRTIDAEQFTKALGAVMGSEELIRTGERDEYLNERFTTVQVQIRQEMALSQAFELQRQEHHKVEQDRITDAAAGRGLDEAQREAMGHLLEDSGIAIVEGLGGAGKNRMLDGARSAWESNGYHVRGASVSRDSVDELQQAAGIQSRSLTSLTRAWGDGEERLTHRSVLVVDNAAYLAPQEMTQVLDAVMEARAKVVFINSADQHNMRGANSPLWDIGELVGSVSFEDVRRQNQDWQRGASLALGHGDTERGLKAYAERGHVHECLNERGAMEAMAHAWARTHALHPEQQQVMLASKQSEVDQLNTLARDIRASMSQLGPSENVMTAGGQRAFGEGDRVVFLRNNRDLGVQDGSLGTIERLRNGEMTVLLDGEGARRRAVFNTRSYVDLNLGYATMVDRAGGMTVDRSYVLASEGLDRKGTYLAMTRHSERVDLFVVKDAFATRDAAFASMGRERLRELDIDDGSVTRGSEGTQLGDMGVTEVSLKNKVRERTDCSAARARPRHNEKNPELRDGGPEARLERLQTYYRLEHRRDEALRTLRQGRTTKHDAWCRLPEVSAGAERLQRAQHAVRQYEAEREAFKRGHPVRASIGLSPTIPDRYHLGGGDQSLSEHLKAARTHLHKQTMHWEKIKKRDDLHRQARRVCREQNLRCDVAQRDLPEMNRFLDEHKEQHAHDRQARAADIKCERERRGDDGLRQER